MSWTSPEVAKLAVATSTPLTVIAVGWWIKQREQFNGELIRKRELDRLMYRYRPFWSQDCWRRYCALVDACFEPFAAGGRPVTR